MGEKSDKAIDKLKKRIDSVIKEKPSHKQVLEFLKEVMTEQDKIKSRVKIVCLKMDKESTKRRIQEGFPLLNKKGLSLDTASATKLFKKLRKVLKRSEEASQDVERINRALREKDINFDELFKRTGAGNAEYIPALSKKLNVKEEILSFLAINSMRPVFEAYAEELNDEVDQERWWRGYCPVCGSEPFLAELRGEGGERGLVCSSCSFRWRFKRLKCPFCGNEDHKGLRYFSTEKEGGVYRVDVCEKCKRYIKTVDTRELREEFIPQVEDMGTLYLDVLAQKEGYTKKGIILGGPINEGSE